MQAAEVGGCTLQDCLELPLACPPPRAAFSMRPPWPPQVWTASDRTISCHSPQDGALLVTLPDQDAFVKQVWAGVVWAGTGMHAR
jgi:hypothetical protein